MTVPGRLRMKSGPDLAPRIPLGVPWLAWTNDSLADEVRYTPS